MKNYLISVGIGLAAYIAIAIVLMQILMVDGKIGSLDAFFGIFVPVLVGLSFTFATSKCK